MSADEKSRESRTNAEASSSGYSVQVAPSRRAFLKGAVAIAAAGAAAAPLGAAPSTPVADRPSGNREPFFGPHQAGVATPLQKHVYFAAFDLTTSSPAALGELLDAWTVASARMTQADTAQPLERPLAVVGAENPVQHYDTESRKYPQAHPEADSGEALGLPAARLTVTFGFGSTLFVKEGADRFGLAKHRPEAFVDLPKFPGDQLVEERTGGDVSVQACADDPQVAFHAVRQLARIAVNVAKIRWTQTGYSTGAQGAGTPRNLMGFKDGTSNPSIHDPAALARVVWVGDEGPHWMRGGTYLVARRIRIALEHWDQMKVAFQEQTVGRCKYSGAPLGARNEFEALNLEANDADGNPVIPENSHVRLAAAQSNEGAQILRRPYSYNEGVNFTVERWPPWRQAMEFDAGLFFLAYQRDPRTGFIKIYEKMSRFDMLNQFVTHVGGGLFACPGGLRPGERLGERLLAT